MAVCSNAQQRTTPKAREVCYNSDATQHKAMSQVKGELCKNKDAKRAGVNEAQGWLKEICDGGKIVALAGKDS